LIYLHTAGRTSPSCEHWNDSSSLCTVESHPTESHPQTNINVFTVKDIFSQSTPSLTRQH